MHTTKPGNSRRTFGVSGMRLTGVVEVRRYIRAAEQHLRPYWLPQARINDRRAEFEPLPVVMSRSTVTRRYCSSRWLDLMRSKVEYRLSATAGP